MLRTGRILMTALGFLCLGLTSARAADLCLSYDGGGGIIVGKAFRIPSPNKCKPFHGFEVGGLEGMVTGTGCTTSNGGSFILHYSYNNYFAYNGGNYAEGGTCNFQFHNDPIPSSGICRGTVVTGSVGGFVQGASLFACNEDVPPR